MKSADGGPRCDLLDRVRRNVDDLKTARGRELLAQDVIEQARAVASSEVLMNSKPRKATRGTSLPSGPAFAPPPAMMARKIPNAAFMAEGHSRGTCNRCNQKTRRLTSERTKAALAQVKARGEKRLGNPKNLAEAKRKGAAKI